GIQTRYSAYPTAQLLLAREITWLDTHSVSLHLLDGDTVTASGRDWDFGAAKAIHRNLVRVPLWAVAPGLDDSLVWLTMHVAQSTAAGLLQPDGSIRWPGREKPTGLAYDADQGIIITRESLPRAAYEDSDESYD